MNPNNLSKLIEKKSNLTAMRARRFLDTQIAPNHFTSTAEDSVNQLDKMIANVDVAIAAERGDSEAQAKVDARNERLMDLADRAMRGDVAAHAEQVNIIQERVNNFIVGQAAWLPFFEVVNLNPQDDFSFINETGQEIAVAEVGEDGKSRTAQLLRDQDRTPVRHYPLASNELEFPLVDFNRGVIADPTTAQNIAARDLSLKLEKILGTAVSNAIGDFTLTGSRSKRTYVAHSNVATDNFPTTNAIDNHADGTFKLNSLISAHEYCAKWGRVFGQEIYPVEIRVPSSMTLGMAREISATTQITETSLSKQIAGEGYVHNLFGKNVVIRGDETLSAATDYAFGWVRTNRPLGRVFFKPALDKHLTALNMAKGPNLGSVKVGKVYAIAVMNPGKVNVIRIALK